MRNHLTIPKARVVFICLGLLFIFPSQADEISNSKEPSGSSGKKSSPSNFSKRKKIKKINDLRIIVDISGSMKKTDPKNLRRSAIRLLAGLVPEGSRAGIWNFGKQVNMSVKIGTVNDAWRKLARAESKKISSAGLYTNIESVMRKASFDWKKADPRYKRNIIILTDGHVDISKDDKINKASRKRILKEVLPTFEKAQVRIHTIALSDDVDESLLSTLSAYTDGLYKKVNSADELQKLFLQMLEQSIKLDTLPIKDNKFSVDESINDMTLLVFNKDKSRPTVVVTPENKSWNKKSHPNSVKWFSDDGYDLITIKKPQKGDWRIQAPSSPDNRVVVATNLKLKLNDIPSYLIIGNPLNISAHLEENGKALTDKRLLSKFNFLLERDAERSAEGRYPLTKSENDDFSYSVQLAAKFKEGNNELIIQAKSPTVEREIRHQFKVFTTPADIKITDNHGNYKVEITPHLNMLRAESIKLSIELNDKSNHVLIQHGDNWLVDVDSKYKDSMFKIKIEGLGANAKPVSMNFNKKLSTESGMKKLDLAAKFEKQEKVEEAHKKEIQKTTKDEKHDSVSKAVEKHTTDKKKNENDKEASSTDEGKKQEANWTFVVFAIVIGNILLVVLLGGGFVYLKRKKEKMAENLEDEMHEGTDQKDSPEDKK